MASRVRWEGVEVEGWGLEGWSGGGHEGGGGGEDLWAGRWRTRSGSVSEEDEQTRCEVDNLVMETMTCLPSTDSSGEREGRRETGVV